LHPGLDVDRLGWVCLKIENKNTYASIGRSCGLIVWHSEDIYIASGSLECHRIDVKMWPCRFFWIGVVYMTEEIIPGGCWKEAAVNSGSEKASRAEQRQAKTGKM